MGPHTPGPWLHRGVDGWDAVQDESGTVICNLSFNNPANATLIAAAPQMLEALKVIAEGKGEFNSDPFERCRNRVDAMMTIASAAIKAAE